MDEGTTQSIQDRIANLEQENGYRAQESVRARRELDYLLRADAELMDRQQPGALSDLFPFLRRSDSAVGPLLYAEMDAVIGRSIRHYGEWCWNEILMVEAIVSKGDMVFDVGGNIGHHSRAFSSIVGAEGRVVAFEPNPFNACILQMNTLIAPLENISVIAAGASDRSGTSSVAPINWRAESNYGEPAIGDGAGNPCAVIRLDDLKLDRLPAFIKVDVEGHEMNVLNGAQALIREARPSLMIEGDDEQTSSICQFLTELEYDVYMYETRTYREDNYRRYPVDIWDGVGYSRNVVCLPRERGIAIRGLDQFDEQGGFRGPPRRVNFNEVQVTRR